MIYGQWSEYLRTRFDEVRDDVFRLSEFIHEHVEKSSEEFECSRAITQVLRRYRFDVIEGVGGLETAFLGSSGDSSAGTVAFLCEYDGLPPYGQSCGHNVGAAASVAAALCLSPVLDQLNVQVKVVGTPAEEGIRGKHVLADAGVFEGVDLAMLIYPGMFDIAASRTLAAHALIFEVEGKAAHAAAHPELGINALDAILGGFNGLSYLRQFLHPQVRVHGIVQDGGRFANIVPDHAQAKVVVRAPNREVLEAAKKRVIACFEAGALSSGASLTVDESAAVSLPLMPNPSLERAFARSLSSTGRTVEDTDPLTGAWSTDAGYLSRFVPLIQPQIQMTDRSVSPHSREFHDASIGGAAEKCITDAAMALALTAIDYGLDESLQRQIREDFDAARQ